MFDRLVRVFYHPAMSPEEKRQVAVVVQALVFGQVLCVLAVVMSFVFPDSSAHRQVLGRGGIAIAAAATGMSLFLLYFRGFTLGFKSFAALSMFAWVYYSGFTGREEVPFHLWGIVILDVLVVCQSNADELAIDRLANFLLTMLLIYIILHVLSVSGHGPDIHPYQDEDDAGLDMDINLVSSVVPILLNYVFLMPYVKGARLEAARNLDTVQLASEVARALANFDLAEADRLMAEDQRVNTVAKSVIREPLDLLLRNLRSYRPFLPNYLFPHAYHDDPTDGIISGAMQGASTSWGHVKSAVERLRDPDYSLWNFHSDMEAAFPELRLYSVEADQWGCSSGFTGQEERQRTLGALYSTYCIARLDIDGKEIFSFGVDELGRPITRPSDEMADKRLSFYRLMGWDQMVELFTRAGLLVQDNPSDAVGSDTLLRRSTKRRILGARTVTTRAWKKAMTTEVDDRSTCPGYDPLMHVNADRMTAFLVLTVIHDIMKNTALTPVVQSKHAPYHGFSEGSPISDHDFALTYVMEHFSGLLPSFNGLEPSQRLPVFFSQGKVEFNNGWLVQGEAPPGALFSTLKSLVTLGGASQQDISFYFAHWLTDLAGAEPFGKRPWPGSEKFVSRFPRHVLVAFLESFSYVDTLACASEVQVMEGYLRHRWATLGLPEQALSDGSSVASMRVALMAQGFEAAAVDALRGLPSRDLDVLASEMSRTGLRAQFESAPSEVYDAPAGPAVLVYYAPALIQKAGAAGASAALRVLAAVFRAARELFPLETSPHAVERTVTIRIEALKVLTPAEIVAAGSWLLRRYSDGYAVAERAGACDVCDGRKASTDLALMDLTCLSEAQAAVHGAADL